MIFAGKKVKYSGKKPIPIALCPTWNGLGKNFGLQGDRSANDRLNYGSALITFT
jgi:hypothetical protein